MKGISSTGMQSNYGFEGQVNACWTHKMTRTEIELIRSAGFLVSIIHGRCIIIPLLSTSNQQLINFLFFYSLSCIQIVYHKVLNA